MGRLRVPLAFVAALVACLALLARGSLAAQACSFTVDAPTITFGDHHGYAIVRATSPAACTWTVSTSDAWLLVPAGPHPSFASLTVGVQVTANTSGLTRQGTVFINGQAAVTVTQGVAPCVSGFDPASIQTTSAGAPRSTNLQTSAPDCAWIVEGFPIWASFPNPTIGRGPTTVTFGFMPNLNGPARSTDISFSGALLHVEQAAPSCLFTATPQEVSMPANGGTGSFQLTGVGTDCAYTAVSQSDAVTITSGATGTAPATIGFTVKPNVLPDNTWIVQVQNVFFRIRQNGAPIRTNGARMIFSAALGPSGVRQASPPATLRITNIEQPNADFAGVPDKPWVVVTPSSGQTPAELMVTLDQAQVALLTPGFYSSLVKLSTSIAPVSTTGFSVSLRVYGPNESWAPFGVFETPLNNTTAAGAIPVTGWALDEFGISKIALYRDPVATEPPGLVFIGDATRVRGARPDVALFTSAPDGDRAGWGYMLLSNVLPGGGNGTFTLHAFAENTEGTQRLLGSRVVTFNNAAAIEPFGTIDVPAQGETISGTILTRGWVLTPRDKTIPIDGSTIKVYIDGVLLSPVASYNHARPDVKAFFPGLNNSDGPEARLSIDTTLLADGVHTIAWGVIDDAGAPVGIGSRYFTVENGAGSLVQPRDTSRATAPIARMPMLKTDVWSREGIDDTAWATRVETDAASKRTLRLPRGQRVELFLDPTLRAACGTYEGHLLSGEVAGPLPAGASLDPQRGIFRWQPTAEFSGVFDFAFVQRGCDTIERRILLTVTIEGRE